MLNNIYPRHLLPTLPSLLLAERSRRKFFDMSGHLGEASRKRICESINGWEPFLWCGGISAVL